MKTRDPAGIFILSSPRAFAEATLPYNKNLQYDSSKSLATRRARNHPYHFLPRSS